MAACSSDPIEDAASTSDLNGQEGDYVTLQIRQAGNGTQKKASAYKRDLGHEYDYKLHDLCLFFYRSDLGTDAMNSPYSTELEYKLYVNQFTQYTNKENDGHLDHLIDAYDVVAEITMPGFRKRNTHHIAAVANVGDITGKVATLGELRNYVPDRSYDYNPADGYTRFAMGLYEDPEWEINGHAGSDEAHHVANVTLERLTARVDFQLNHFPSAAAQESDEHAPIPYNVEVGGNILARNWITHARLVNAMQHPSYLIRRTADDPKVNATSPSVNYLGFERKDLGVVTNTYLTPFTSDLSVYTGAYLFGNTALDISRATDFTADEQVISRQASAEYHNDGQYYYIIGYPQENTLRTDQMLRQYATGILYRTVYEPATVWRLNSAGDGIESETAPLSTSVLSTGGVAAGGTLGSHYGKTFWMMEELVPQPTEANRIYFMSDKADEAEALADVAHAINIYKVLHPEVGYTDAQKFTDGVAYNYYWLRHAPSQGQGHPFTPMEYSVVRNNIYSVKIESFSGPGAPSTDPSMDNPDRIQPITYVHPWHPYEVEEIEM